MVNCLDTGRITGTYIIFCQGRTIDHGTHVPVPVAHSSGTAGMPLAHFRMLINEFLNKDTDIITEQVPLIILDSKYYVCVARNGKDT